MKKICIIGLGYIGLPTAAMFASKGHSVVGVDINKNVIDELNKGNIVIEEPFLGDIVKNCVKNGNLIGSLNPVEADVFIICVPTPINKDKTADMHFVENAAKSIVSYIKKGDIVILESTSPPKTTENLIVPIMRQTGLAIGDELLIAHSPERVIPGKIIYELENNDRVVGGVNETSALAVKRLYECFVKGNIYTTDSTTAEMCKLMENTYRDVNIALANELAKISESLGINAWDVIELSNKHPRVNIHQPGPGVGGHCIAVDPWFIVEKAPSLSNIINICRNTNDSMPGHVVELIKMISGNIKGEKVLVLGITYKPDVDDMRESPIVHIESNLRDEGVEVIIADPHVDKYAKNAENIYDAAKDCIVTILAVHHKEFENIDFKQLKNNMKLPNLLDTRNFYNKEEVEALGMNYYLLGSS